MSPNQVCLVTLLMNLTWVCVSADCFLEFSTDFSSFPDDNMPIQSKGGYNLDFDNLDNINPFQGSNKMILSPPRPTVENHSIRETDDIKSASISEESSKIDSALDETLPFTPSVENSLADISANISSTESSVVTVSKAVADSYSVTPDEKQCATMSPNADEDQVSGTSVEDASLPAKASYTLDFDNLDALNPFQTGGSKIPNSPVLGRDDNLPTEEITENKTPDVIDLPSASVEAPIQPDNKLVAEAQISANVAISAVMESQLSDVPVKGGSFKLEFNFDDGNDVGRKPQTKKFGKRPSSVKSKEGKLPSDQTKPKEIPVNPDNAEVDISAPEGSYSFNFDKFDDPNFNPFGTKSNINNSPKYSKDTTPVVADDPVAEKMEKIVEKEAASSMWCVHIFMCIHFLVFLKFV